VLRVQPHPNRREGRLIFDTPSTKSGKSATAFVPPLSLTTIFVTVSFGAERTVIVTAGLFDEVQPFASVTVSVYVVVVEGDALGEQLPAFDRPAAGVHEQLAPPEPVRGADPPTEISAEPEAIAVGEGRIVADVVAEREQVPTVVVTV
jgi:hypothetical protein